MCDVIQAMIHIKGTGKQLLLHFRLTTHTRVRDNSAPHFSTTGSTSQRDPGEDDKMVSHTVTAGIHPRQWRRCQRTHYLPTCQWLCEPAQPDSTVLNPVISPKLWVARFTSMLWQSYILHEIQLTQEEALLEPTSFTGSMPLSTPNHSFKTCGGLEAFTSTTILRNVVEKLPQEVRHATSWKLIRRSSPTQGTPHKHTQRPVFMYVSSHPTSQKSYEQPMDITISMSAGTRHDVVPAQIQRHEAEPEGQQETDQLGPVLDWLQVLLGAGLDRRLILLLQVRLYGTVLGVEIIHILPRADDHKCYR